MPTELEFYQVKLAIAKGMFGYKAVNQEQFDRCHVAALNVFDALGTPAHLFDGEFMRQKLNFTYVDKFSDHRGTYRHEIQTAIDMFETGLCDELWHGLALALIHNEHDSYTLLDGQVTFETLGKEVALDLFVRRIGENL